MPPAREPGRGTYDFPPPSHKGWEWAGTFTEVAHQRVNLSGEAEPAFELFLAELTGLAHKEVARFLMVLARHDDEGTQPIEPHTRAGYAGRIGPAAPAPAVTAHRQGLDAHNSAGIG